MVVDLPHSGLEVVSLMAGGIGLAVWLTDRESPTSRWLALFMALTGAAVIGDLRAVEALATGGLPLWVRATGLIEALAFCAGCEWGMRVGRTATEHDPVPLAELRVRAAQGLGLLYAGFSAYWPELRAEQFLAVPGSGRPGPAFWLFAAPAGLAALLVFSAGIGVLRRRIDAAERVRIMAMLGAMPLLLGSVLVPADFTPVMLALGEIVFLVGALRYHVIQGVRAQFLERFLAPQVAELVRERGIKYLIRTRRVRATVVACDIRGFTAGTRDRPPEAVIRLLRDFYAGVGAAAASVGGTIKDLAGDGALVLVGAPLPYEDHAARALRMGEVLRREVRAVLRRHGPELGLGIGIATGDVATGIAGEGARLEYVAVGPAVNLAARLCEQCADGELRVDATTLREAGVPLGADPEPIRVKGLDEPVETYVL